MYENTFENASLHLDFLSFAFMLMQSYKTDPRVLAFLAYQ